MSLLGGIPAKVDFTALWNWLATVKTAVDQNTTDVTTLKTDDANTQSTVSGLQSQVGANTTDITTLKGQVSTLQTDDTNAQNAISGLQTQANSNGSSIATLQGQVSTLQTDDTNTQNTVSGLQTQVNTNTSNIATNTNNIATNTSNIATLQTQVNTNTSDINTLKSSQGSSGAGEVVSPSGADPTGAADSTTAIQTALNTGKDVYLPAGTYKCSATLTAPGNNVRLRGAGAGATVLSFTGTTYDYLVVGGGAGNQVRPTGWLKDLTVRGPSAAPVSGKAAVVINGLNQFAVENVQADNADIGFDLRNNCYGTGFRNIRAGFGSSCNVGVYLRTGPQSGSDLTFNNPWVAGKVAAFHVAGNGGGFHVFGGQVGAGQGTAGAVDTSAAFCLGKDYLTGALGTTDIDLHGVSFEGTNNAWCFRAFDQVRVVVDGCAFNPVDQTHQAVGLFKSDNYKNSRVLLTGNIVSGFWAGPKLVAITNDWGGDYWWEVGTYTAAQAPTIAGTSTFVDSFIAQSGKDGNAVVVDRLGIEFGGVKLRNNAGVLEQSVDGGTTWAPVSTGSGGGTPPPATGGTVAIAPSPTFPGVYAVTLSA